MQGARRREVGFNLIEVTIVMTILVAMVFVVLQLVLRSNQAHSMAMRLSRSIEVNQELLQDMRSDVGKSVRLFENNALGNAYLNLLDFTGAVPAIASTLPTMDLVGNFRKEATSGVLSGNTLLFGKHDWTDEFMCTSGNQYMLEVYRLVRLYLAEEDGGPRAGSPAGLNLCRWVGEPMVDGSQVDRISDPVDRAEVLEHLRLGTPDLNGLLHPPAELVWKVGADPAVVDTLRQIAVGGTLSNSPLVPRSITWEILRDSDQSSDGLLHYQHFSVMTNYAPANFGVGAFSVLDNSGDGYPHGFEVQIIGPSSGRQVLLHLIVASNLPGLLAGSNQKLIISTRDI